MKKIFALVLALILALFIAAPALANVGWFDFNYDFGYVTLRLDDGYIIKAICEKWWDFDNSDMIQVQIDGNVYLTHISNVVLSKNEPAWW